MAKSSGSSGKGTSVSDAYGEYAASMAAAGVQGLDGRGASSSGKSSSGKSSGPSASSPAGGSQAAAGYSGGSRGSAPSHGGGQGPSPSSPAGGAQAASGFSPSAPSYGGGLAQAAGISPPSISARSAETASMAALAGLGGAAGLVPSSIPGITPPSVSARQAETESMAALRADRYASMSRQDKFLADVYSSGRRAGLNDVEARLAASQAALETRYGRSVVGNNYFGIKAGRSWAGPTVNAKTWEEVDGARVNTSAAFRSYAAPEQSLRDWKGLIDRNWSGVSKASTFDEAAAALNPGKAGGYATDSKYESKLASIQARGERAGAFSSVFGSPSRSETATSVASLPERGPIPEGRPSLETGTPALASASPADRFAQTYLAPQMAASGGLMPPAAVSRQGDDLNPNRGSPQPGDLARGLGPEPIEAAVQVASAEPAAPSTSFPPAPAEPGQKTGRSVGGRIAAGAIDTAAGFIPGVGIAATGFNVLAGLTGNRTIGERAVDLFGRGSGTPGVAPGSEYGGGYDELPPPSIGPKEDKKDDSTRFADTYLAFSDPTQRPTPKEKWSRATA